MASLGLYFVTLAIGGGMLAVVHRLKGTSAAWISHYYYYLLFFYVGTLAGQVVPIVVRELAAPPQRTATSLFWILQATLALPASLLALYWFGRFAADLSGRAWPRGASTGYFIGAGVAVLLFLAWTAGMLAGVVTFWPPSLYEIGMTSGAVVVCALACWAWFAARRGGEPGHASFVRSFAVLFVGGLLIKWMAVTFGHVEERWHDLLRTLLNLPSFLLLVGHPRRRSIPGAPAEAEAMGDDTLAARLGVTKRELEVVRLACAGHTNKEIGARLFIAPQTVKQHLYSVYQKLGIENRVQLVNAVREASSGKRS